MHHRSKALGQDLAPFPCAALQQELSEPRPVSRGGVEVGAADESTSFVGFEDCAVHSQRAEKRFARPFERGLPITDRVLPDP